MRTSKPEKMKILDINADIKHVQEYVRHKERATSHNACKDQYDTYLAEHLVEVTKTIALLNSMVICGEAHSFTSDTAVNKAFEIINNILQG